MALLGFGLDVFDVACAANQGDVEKLSAMKPAERKRMVDQVIGLDKIEELAKWCGDEAKVLERAIVDPGEEPVPPAEEWDEELFEEAQAAYEELHRLKGVLSVDRDPPKEPTCSMLQTSDRLRPLAEAERENRAELSMLQARLRALPQASRLQRRRTRQDRTGPRGVWPVAAQAGVRAAATPGPPTIASSCWSCWTIGRSSSRPDSCTGWSRNCAPTARSTARTASTTSTWRAGGSMSSSASSTSWTRSRPRP